VLVIQQRYESAQYFLKIRCMISKSNFNLALKCRSYSVSEEYITKPVVFDPRPTSFWNDFNNQRQFINWAAERLNIKEPSDWYSKTAKVRT
jgi:hypothetical protein